MDESSMKDAQVGDIWSISPKREYDGFSTQHYLILSEPYETEFGIACDILNLTYGKTGRSYGRICVWRKVA